MFSQSGTTAFEACLANVISKLDTMEATQKCASAQPDLTELKGGLESVVNKLEAMDAVQKELLQKVHMLCCPKPHEHTYSFCTM